MKRSMQAFAATWAFLLLGVVTAIMHHDPGATITCGMVFLCGYLVLHEIEDKP